MKFSVALAALALSLGVMGQCAFAAEPAAAPAEKNNILTMAVAYKQTAAEYRALYYQGFNIAKLHVDAALAAKKAGDKCLCVITDVDDTIALHDHYWGTLIANGEQAFNDPVWDAYIPTNQLIAAPGAKEFLDYCKSKDVEVFYVTSRDQGEGTYEMALENLKFLGFPYADRKHLTVLVDTSNKETRQQEIAKTYTPVVYLGDSLNDFQRNYYVKDVAERAALLDADKDLYGMKYVIMPNPTDGHWIRAIFGESEPADTPENRATWFVAATGKQLKSF